MVRKAIQAVHNQIKKLTLPRILLMNNVGLEAKHLDDVLEENKIEREWYKSIPPVQNTTEILAAVSSGDLVKVVAGKYYLPIMRYRNPKLVETYPPYLTPKTKALLEEVGTRWRKQADKVGLDKEIRLAVTSMLRTERYQKTLVDAGKLADPQSVHTKGEAFDIEAGGYYLADKPVNGRKERHDEFHKAFKKMKAELPKADYQDYSKFDRRFTSTLKEVLEEMMKENKLHYVIEYPDTTNATFHICRHPEYTPPATIAA